MVDVAIYRPGTPSWIDWSGPDLAAAEDFYTGLFGWETGKSSFGDGHRMCRLRGHEVAGLAPGDGDGAASWLTYVAVTDVDAAAEAVREAGGTVLTEPADVGRAGRKAVFADPVGATFAVWQARRHRGALLVNEPSTLRKNDLATWEPDAVIDFYGAVFGWEAFETEVSSRRYVDWHLKGSVVAGMNPMDERWPAGLPAHWLVIFEVADPDAAAERARDLGAEVLTPPTGVSVGRFATLMDPQGAVFNIIRLGHE